MENSNSRFPWAAVRAIWQTPLNWWLVFTKIVRSDALLRTVKSIQRGDFPTRRAAAARAAPSTPRLVSAARVGPVVYGLLLTFRGDGYG